MVKNNLTLSVLSAEFAICRLPADAEVPNWTYNSEFSSITRTADELSIVCFAKDTPTQVQADRHWRVLKVNGPLDLFLTGILADLANPLAQAEIQLFALSTFETDYILVQSKTFEQVLMAVLTCVRPLS